MYVFRLFQKHYNKNKALTVPLWIRTSHGPLSLMFHLQRLKPTDVSRPTVCVKTSKHRKLQSSRA